MHATKPMTAPLPALAQGRPRWERWVGAVEPYLFVLPALLFYSLFLALPILGVVAISLLDWSGISMRDIAWAGLGNYQTLAGDPVFWQALWHNVVFIGAGASVMVGLGLVLAVLLEQGLRGSNFFRGVFFIPTVTSMVVVGIVFVLILSPELGLVNPLLRSLNLGGLQRAWLGDPATALPTVIGVDVWKNFGLSMFLFVAGLKGVPAEYYEAASIDGASGWRQFWDITLPALRPVTAVAVSLATINTLKLFDLVYVMTAGGPNNASEVLTTWMYAQGFMFNNMGYGSALAVVLLAITFVVTVVQFRITSRSNEV
ncbi:MAG: sugar ABC transporter permease [Chloroflexia bacterium]|nr:sugar ABC transporter permease [Chloroflexia bacterium]